MLDAAAALVLPENQSASADRDPNGIGSSVRVAVDAAVEVEVGLSMSIAACRGSAEPRSPALARVRLTETAGDAAACAEVETGEPSTLTTGDVAEAGVIDPNTIAPTLRASTTAREGCFTG